MATSKRTTSPKRRVAPKKSTESSLTLNDIAKAAGVTLATASRSINGAYGVHPDTRQRVLAVADKLNYKPNTVARGLATGRSNSIGLIVTDIRNAFFAEVARGAEDAAYAAGCDVILCNSDLDSSRQMRYFNAFLEKRVAGIIMNSVTSLTCAEQDYIANSGIPVVLLNRPAGNMKFSTVTANNRQGGELAAKQLLEAGHRHLVHFTGPRMHPNFSKRLAGCKNAVAKFGGQATLTVFHGTQNLAGGYEMARALFESRAGVTAITTGNDAIALGVIKAAHEMGFRIPDDFSLVGFDDVEIASLTYPSLSTIRQPKYEAGQAAVRLLLGEAIKSGSPEHLLLPVQFMGRMSVAPLQ